MRRARFMLMQYEKPGSSWLAPIAVLLLDEAVDTLHIRGRTEFESIAGPEDAEVLALLVAQLVSDTGRSSGISIIQRLQDTLSNTVRITDPTPLQVADIDTALLALYRRHVESSA